jgi:hypothetical protein
MALWAAKSDPSKVSSTVSTLTPQPPCHRACDIQSAHHTVHTLVAPSQNNPPPLSQIAFKTYKPTTKHPTAIDKHTIHATNMSSRFGRDTARDDLFSSYNRSASPSKSKSKARASPYNAGGYGLPADGPGFSAYPSNSTNTNGSLYGGYGAGSGYGVGAKKSDDGYGGGLNGGYRAATPNSRGQYGSATLDELESQNEEQTGVLIGKVKMLKDVCFLVEARALRGRARKPFCYLFPISSQLVAQASLTMNS